MNTSPEEKECFGCPVANSIDGTRMEIEQHLLCCLSVAVCPSVSVCPSTVGYVFVCFLFFRYFVFIYGHNFISYD